MRLVLTVLTLICAELLAHIWASAFIRLDAFNIYTNMLTFAVVDSLTLYLLSYIKVARLTFALQVLLSLSIANHTYGGLCWIAYDDLGLELYDELKSVIFYVEIMVLMLYGIFRGGKGRRAMATSPSMVSVSDSQGVSRNQKAVEGK